MLFSSFEFLVFLPIVFSVYWFALAGHTKAQNIFIVAASYVFYGWWDYRFLALIIFSTAVDYTVGRAMGATENNVRRKYLLWLSVCINLGVLGFFKYHDFFVQNLVDAFGQIGVSLNARSLNLILPVGISFYTFQTLSYSIDVFRKKLRPSNDIIAFSAFVSFFPQLVAGPIERATHLLPQFLIPRKFSYVLATDGLRQILWGFFKKVVIADNCAIYVDTVFGYSAFGDHSASTLVIAAIFFAFQIYGDFSGYSDIAIGVSKLFGFDLMRNFAFPYFSRDIAEFWRRWHISLTTWFRDYLYIPLGGNQVGTLLRVRNTFIIFLVSGFWHGANWTFIVWGALNAIYFLPLLLTGKNRVNMDIVANGRMLPSLKEVFQMSLTFALTVFAWIFFRASSVGDAWYFIKATFDRSFFDVPEMQQQVGILGLLLSIFLIGEWIGRDGQHVLAKVTTVRRRSLRWFIYSLILILIGVFMRTEETPFIYFQF